MKRCLTVLTIFVILSLKPSISKRIDLVGVISKSHIANDSHCNYDDADPGQFDVYISKNESSTSQNLFDSVLQHLIRSTRSRILTSWKSSYRPSYLCATKPPVPCLEKGQMLWCEPLVPFQCFHLVPCTQDSPLDTLLPPTYREVPRVMSFCDTNHISERQESYETVDSFYLQDSTNATNNDFFDLTATRSLLQYKKPHPFSYLPSTYNERTQSQGLQAQVKFYSKKEDFWQKLYQREFVYICYGSVDGPRDLEATNGKQSGFLKTKDQKNINTTPQTLKNTKRAEFKVKWYLTPPTTKSSDLYQRTDYLQPGLTVSMRTLLIVLPIMFVTTASLMIITMAMCRNNGTWLLSWVGGRDQRNRQHRQQDGPRNRRRQSDGVSNRTDAVDYLVSDDIFEEIHQQLITSNMPPPSYDDVIKSMN